MKQSASSTTKRGVGRVDSSRRAALSLLGGVAFGAVLPWASGRPEDDRAFSREARYYRVVGER